MSVDVTKHLALVDWSIRRWWQPHIRGRIEYDDLVQAGRMGLMRAAEKFDESRGVKFSTYALFFIRAYIQRYVKNNQRLVHVSTHAQNAGLAPPERLCYLDARAYDDGRMVRHELVGDDDREFDRLEARLDVEELLAMVPDERERRVLRLRMREHLLDDIGAELSRTRRPRPTAPERTGLSHERVRQLEASALSSIRVEQLRRPFERR